jgi:hypothetical protein
VVFRYHPEGNFLAHLWTVVGTRFGESVRGTDVFEILCVENISISGVLLTSGISDDDDGTFALAAADAAAEYASKSREHWRLELEDTEDFLTDSNQYPS